MSLILLALSLTISQCLASCGKFSGDLTFAPWIGHLLDNGEHVCQVAFLNTRLVIGHSKCILKQGGL